MMFHYQRAYLQYMSILRYFKMASLGGTPFISILQSGLHLCLEVPLQLWWHPDFQRTGLHLAEIIATAINGHLDHPTKPGPSSSHARPPHQCLSCLVET